jgi:hypothetical protein
MNVSERNQQEGELKMTTQERQKEYEISRRMEKAEKQSAARLEQLFKLEEDRRREWTRAENAEAELASMKKEYDKLKKEHEKTCELLINVRKAAQSIANSIR